jgi:TolB-like protein
MSDSNPDQPDHDEIRSGVERVMASEVFARSPQLGAFLRFVVDAVLRGKADRIKAYTIGVEVLRRDINFDPQLDPIVRVEATRLRRALERYYAGPGSTDPIVVDLPRGSYVPTFRKRQRETHVPPIAGARRWMADLNRPPVLAALAGLAIIAVSALIGLVLDRGPAVTGTVRPPVSLTGPAADMLPPGNGMPSILIDPIRVVGKPGAGPIAPELLQAKVSDAFARFDTVNVVAAGSAGPASVAATDASSRYNYRLSGTVEFSGDVANVWFALTDMAEGNVVWSRTFEQAGRAGSTGQSEEAIVITLTNALLQSYGVIRSRDRAKHLVSAAGDPRYRCVLEAADAIRTGDRASHDKARACLEHLTMVDPSFAIGFTFLALTYNREFQLGYELRPGDAPPLERALRAVREAVNLHPENSRGYLALMVVQFNRRDIAAAIAAGDKCRSLNKYDMLALGEYGGRLVLAGDVDRGMTLLGEAGAGGAVRPSWHNIYMFLGSYILGDQDKAAYFARQIPTDQMALGQVAKSLAAQIEGNGDQARRIAEDLGRTHPSWRADPKAQLARLIADRGMIDRIARDLAELGLSGGS